jgi:hypothetical protein
MNQREKNNLRADAVGDQVKACIRDGESIPDDLDIIAAAARLPLSMLPPSMRDVCENLQQAWAEMSDVDMVE